LRRGGGGGVWGGGVVGMEKGRPTTFLLEGQTIHRRRPKSALGGKVVGFNS